MRFKILMIVIFLGMFLSLSSQCISGNCRDGEGTFIFKSGGKYQGQFKRYRLTGKGKYTFSNGNIYIGDWKNNFREGRGKLKMITGDVYVGDFSASKFWGNGTYKYSNGEKYVGNWENNQANGKGEYTFVNGDKYRGEFVNGDFDGFGIYLYEDGSKYVGYWKDNMKNGDGKFVDSNGKTTEGIWKKDQLVEVTFVSKEEKKVEIEYQPESKYPNCNIVPCVSGLGTYTYKDGSVWKGNFLNGKPLGYGTCDYVNGNRYVGSWKNNLPQGEGTYYTESGDIYGGIWDKGVLVNREEVEGIENDNTEIVEEKKSDPKVNIWALIIGVGSYNHMPVLMYTDDDAYQVYAFLKSPQGGAIPDERIRLLIDENATSDNIENGLSYIVSNADKNDVIFVYYAGHGVEGSFVPYDFDGSNNLYSHKRILEYLDKSKAKHKLLVADACHAGSMIAQRAPFGKMLAEYYADFETTNGGTALIMSSKQEENSLEYSGMRQGVFSYYFIKGLKGDADYDNNGIVTVNEVFDYCYISVRKHTRNKQTPLISGSFDKNMPVSAVMDVDY